MLQLFKAEWILIGCQSFLSFISWKNGSESESNDLISLRRYHYSCAVNSFTFKNYIFMVIITVNVLGCERAFIIRFIIKNSDMEKKQLSGLYF